MNKTVSFTVLVSDETAVVEATAPTLRESGEGSVKGSGWAKKHPKDKADQEVGYDVAMARALRALADEYDKRAEEAMANPVQHIFLDALKQPYTMTLNGLYDSNYLSTLKGAY